MSPCSTLWEMFSFLSFAVVSSTLVVTGQVYLIFMGVSFQRRGPNIMLMKLSATMSSMDLLRVRWIMMKVTISTTR